MTTTAQDPIRRTSVAPSTDDGVVTHEKEKYAAKHEDFDVYGEDDESADSTLLFWSFANSVLCSHTFISPVKYRTMVWWKAAALMLAETVSLGVRCGCLPARACY